MKVLILGFSSIAQRKVIPSLQNIKTVSNIEIASKSKKVPLARKISKSYNSYEKAINNSDAEIVYISLPNNYHYKYSELCLANSKHVIVDKPSVLNKSELKKIKLLASKKNRCISESTPYLYHKALEKFKTINKNQKGVLITTFTVPAFDKSNFRNSLRLGGGAVNDMGVYAASMGRYFWDTDSESLSVNINTKRKLDITFSITANYGQGRDMIGYFGFEKNYSNQVSFIGETKTTTLERVFSAPKDLCTQIIVNKNINNEKKIINIGEDDSFQNYLTTLFKKIKQRNIDLINKEFYESNLETLKIMEFKNK